LFQIVHIVAAAFLNAAEVNIRVVLLAFNLSVDFPVQAIVLVTDSENLVVDSAVSQEAQVSMDIHQHILDVFICDDDILVVLRVNITIVIISLFNSFWGRADFGIVASLHAWGTTSCWRISRVLNFNTFGSWANWRLICFNLVVRSGGRERIIVSLNFLVIASVWGVGRVLNFLVVWRSGAIIIGLNLLVIASVWGVSRVLNLLIVRKSGAIIISLNLLVITSVWGVDRVFYLLVDTWVRSTSRCSLGGNRVLYFLVIAWIGSLNWGLSFNILSLGSNCGSNWSINFLNTLRSSSCAYRVRLGRILLGGLLLIRVGGILGGNASRSGWGLGGLSRWFLVVLGSYLASRGVAWNILFFL
jgi:hypothetical protein